MLCGPSPCVAGWRAQLCYFDKMRRAWPTGWRAQLCYFDEEDLAYFRGPRHSCLQEGEGSFFSQVRAVLCLLEHGPQLDGIEGSRIRPSRVWVGLQCGKTEEILKLSFISGQGWSAGSRREFSQGRVSCRWWLPPWSLRCLCSCCP